MTPIAALTRALAELWGRSAADRYVLQRPSGRLKLRETAGLQAELIAYERDEHAHERLSDSEVARTLDPAPLLDVLTPSLGVIAVVRKRRTLVALDTTRIHLDNVEQLGSFLEIEVPVSDDEALAKARFDSLLASLGYKPADGIRASYLDLLLTLQGESRA